MAGLTFKAPVFSNSAFSHGSNPDYSYVGGVAADITAVGDQTGPNGDSIPTVQKWNDVWSELSGGGIATMSLADIEQARKTAAFAKLRASYDGIDDEYIIDLLMQGITVPTEVMKQPMLIGQQTGMFGFSQRFATDSGNLDDTATNG